MKVGFIGLGIMGRPMALNLQRSGYKIYTVQNRSPIAQDLLDGGAVVYNSAKEVAEKSDVIITMLPDTPYVENVLFGKNGVSEGLPEGQIIIDMSSISSAETKKFAERIKELGGEYLDAPVSGGDVGATNATLSIMVGGDGKVFNKVKPLFEVMGKNITLVGDNGAGQTCKIANQIVVALNIEAVSEALVFASKAGADPEKVREALMGGFASSRILDVHGQRMIEGNFAPGFRVSLHQKDLRLALEGAKELGVSLPNTETVQEMFNECVTDKNEDEDHSVIVKILENRAGHKIKKNKVPKL